MRTIDADDLKKHKFTVQQANGVEIEDIDVVPLACIDNAPTVEASNEVPIIRINKPLESEQIVKLKKLIEEQMNNDKCVLIPNYCEIINPAKTPQGEWIIVTDKYGKNVKCPFCGKEIAGSDLNYCVKCGAKMEGGAE